MYKNSEQGFQASDDFYKMLFSKIALADNLPKIFNEDEVARFLRVSAQSNDRKLELISAWAESNSNLFNKADATFDVFTRFLEHIDATQISESAINKFLHKETLFALNRDCRKYLKALSSPRLVVFGQSKDDDDVSIISTVEQFRQDNQPVVDVRFPHLCECRVASLNGVVYVLGGWDEKVRNVNVETGVVSEGPPTRTKRTYFAVATSADEIFACGGWKGGEGFLTACERLRPAESSTWSAMPSLAQKRSSAAAVVLGGDRQLLVAGGYDGDAALSSVELLNLRPQQSSEWIAVAPMRQARSCHGMCLFRGRVVVAGGYTTGGVGVNSAEMFSPPQATGDREQWTALQPLSQIRGPLSLTVWQDRLLAFGRYDRCKIERLVDPRHDRTNGQTEDDLPQFVWRPAGDLSEKMENVDGAVAVQNKTN